ncbi:hypothetical protein AK830_g1538 [Neonectria ditissima]|uniref:Uncharacterized protein n=1 Tax=Neonectria ditissima TaxID=78410 RepID=A0A0P7BU18_9HYPO|nr:hypothetical protein AK830_g1538 [Neonectria ditissima]
MPAADEPHTAAGQREKVLPLPLTAPPPQEDDRSRGDGVTTLRVGESLRLDALGPLVVNTDGSVARVGNWAGMTDGEQKATLRLLGKRNQQRLAALKAKLAAEEAAGENEGGSGKP